MKIVFTTILILCSISLSLAQEPGKAYHPETANGASNVYYQYHWLKWQNSVNTVFNKIYISYDSSKVANMDTSALFISGYPSTAFDSIQINQQLYKPTRYFWCVIEYSTNGFTQGDVWYFTTTWDNIDFNQLDDFSFGLGKWNINNNSGCGWQLGEENNYMLPAPSTGKVLAADAFQCGSAINSTADFQQTNDMQFMFEANLQFTSDWKTDNPQDSALVEMSTNGGNTWFVVWKRLGVSDRNKRIDTVLFFNNRMIDTIYIVQVRFMTIQHGTNSWWAVDNVGIIGFDGILTHVHPLGLHVHEINENPPRVLLTWGQILSVPGEIVERKIGIPSDTNSYQVIGEAWGYINDSYVDSTVSDSMTYTYIIGNAEGGFGDTSWFVYSNEATAYIPAITPVELTSFNANIIDSKVHLSWQTATETNNRGFEIERSQPLEASLAEGGKSKLKSQTWENIGFVNGQGTTTQPKNYSFTDNEKLSGSYKYRLRQIDFNGSFKYSKVVEVIVTIPAKFSLEQNYPNPFNPTTTIEYSVGSQKMAILKVYDVLGREVATLVNEVKQPGDYEIEFDGSKLASGIYFYKLTAGNFIDVKKMIIQK